MSRLALPAVLFLSALPVCAQITASVHTLDNGLKLIVHEDHDIPNAAMYLFYRIGSRNEQPGVTGMSHFFEHMMFNGSKKYGPKQFDIQMEKNGGHNNAYTSRDLTVYTNWFPSSALELMFDLEADRIRDLSFDPKIIESERGVVYSERRSSIENNNFGLLYEQLYAAAFTAHPYQWPVVGWSSDIESWTMDDLKSHFRTGYAPNNCLMVVAGAVNSSEVVRLARKYLEPIPRQAPPPAVRTKEPAQAGERRVEVRRAAQAPIVLMAYHVPPASHADFLALDVLHRLLTGGRSSRLYRRLVDKDQLVVDVDAGSADSLDPGLFVIRATVRPGTASGAVERAIEEELEALKSSGATQVEMEKVRNQALGGFYRSLTTIAGKANAIGNAEIYRGSWEKLNAYPAGVAAVAAADVQRVASEYLASANRTIATLVPSQEAK